MARRLAEAMVEKRSEGQRGLYRAAALPVKIAFWRRKAGGVQAGGRSWSAGNGYGHCGVVHSVEGPVGERVEKQGAAGKASWPFVLLSLGESDYD